MRTAGEALVNEQIEGLFEAKVKKKASQCMVERLNVIGSTEKTAVPKKS